MAKAKPRKRQRRLVILDDSDRVIAGLPMEYHGVHVDDLNWYAERSDEIKDMELDCRRLAGAASTFGSKDHAVAALLSANPLLDEFLQTEWTAREQAYRIWIRSGRPGPKPVADIRHDGRFDAFNEGWDLHGRKRVTNWLEAVYTTIPTSRKWADLAERLPVLEEATGLRLNFPEEAEVVEAASATGHECMLAIERLLDELERCRRERCEIPADEEEMAQREPGIDIDETEAAVPEPADEDEAPPF